MFTQRVAAKLFDAREEDRFTKKFMRLIGSLDTGINRFRVRKLEEGGIPSDADKRVKQFFLENFGYRIETEHDLLDRGKKVDVTYLPLEEESIGTQKERSNDFCSSNTDMAQFPGNPYFYPSYNQK